MTFLLQKYIYIYKIIYIEEIRNIILLVFKATFNCLIFHVYHGQSDLLVEENAASLINEDDHTISGVSIKCYTLHAMYM